jgi:CHASE2 domain-containing sensor protein
MAAKAGRRWISRHAGPAALGILMVAAICTLRMIDPSPFLSARLATFDEFQRMRPWGLVQSPVRVVDIDDDSLARFGQWPWSRSLIASMVRRLQDAGAAAVAFDVVFAEPDRTSPARLAGSWAARYGWTIPGGTAALPDYDKELAAAFARGRVVTGFGLVEEPNGAQPPLSTSVATIGGDPTQTLPAVFHGAVLNLPVLDAAAAGKGSFSIKGGHDQVVRRLPLLLAINGKLVPSLALEALRVGVDEDTIAIRVDRDGGKDGPVTGYTVRVGDYDLPLNTDGTLQLAPGDDMSRIAVSALRLIDAPADATLDADLKGKIVLIGTSAVGLSDLRATPINPLEPGVNLHARAIEQIMVRHFLTRPSWATGAELLAAILLSGLLIALATLCNFSTAIPAGLLIASATVCGAWVAFVGADWLIDPSFILLCLLVGGATSSLARYLVAERDASKLRSAFTHYLSPDLVAALARDPDRLKLGGELREMTFLFTDLEGFTSLMESADPEEAVSRPRRARCPLRAGDRRLRARLFGGAAGPRARFRRHPHRGQYGRGGGRQFRRQRAVRLYRPRRRHQHGGAPGIGEQGPRHPHLRRPHHVGPRDGDRLPAGRNADAEGQVAGRRRLHPARRQHRAGPMDGRLRQRLRTAVAGRGGRRRAGAGPARARPASSRARPSRPPDQGRRAVRPHGRLTRRSLNRRRSWLPRWRGRPRCGRARTARARCRNDSDRDRPRPVRERSSRRRRSR